MALTAAVTFILTLSFTRKAFNDKLTEVDRLSEKYSRLNELDMKVQEEFYKDVPNEDVIDGMLTGYISGLGDPYSVYRSAKELSDYQDNNAGVYTGIGIVIQLQENGDVKVLSVTEGGSAEKAGIEADDLLLSVEGVSVYDDYKGAIDKIAGDVGTSVSLRIKKSKTGKELPLSVKRAQLDEITVTSEMLEDNIGYIRIAKFRSVTSEQFEEARQRLLKEGAKGFIFDVRDNGGGVVAALERLADPILPEGDLAFSYSKNGESNVILKSDKNYEAMPYVVLVNGKTASASELFACVLRDYADAVIVGEKTFGKGIMQTTFPLSSGGVTLTTATYKTGKSECYHGIGLEPDVLSELDEDAETDTQLDDAIKTIRKRVPAEANESTKKNAA